MYNQTPTKEKRAKKTFMVATWANIPVFLENRKGGMYMSYRYPVDITVGEIHLTHIKLEKASLEQLAFN